MDISELAPSRPPSVSPNSVDYSLHKCIFKLAQSRSRSASLRSLNQGLQVSLQICSITASKCICKVARSRPPCASLSSLNISLQVRIQTRLITASKCISEFTRSLSPSASQTPLIKYIFNERWRLSGYTGVMEVDRVTGGIYWVDPGVIDIISFPSSLLIQFNFTLYFSQIVVSLALSEISWIHAIALILTAGEYHI